MQDIQPAANGLRGDADHAPVVHALADRGWALIGDDPALRDWITATLDAARRTLHDPANRQWWRHGDTWFAGVNVLDNDTHGAVAGGLPLQAFALECARRLPGGDVPLDRAQVSVCLPGYPQPSAEESDANHRFRKNRDAAHIDGLRRHGPERRRFPGEQHAWILGIPMSTCDPGAAPFTVWEGSHHLALAAFRDLLGDVAMERWSETDVTDEYHALRRRVFSECPRREIHAVPGQAYLVHRLALHGMAPWDPAATAGPDGRMICYFRPALCDPADWIRLD